MLLGEQRFLKPYLGAVFCMVVVVYLWTRPQRPNGVEHPVAQAETWAPSISDINNQRVIDSRRMEGFELSAADSELLDHARSFHQIESPAPMERDADRYAHENYRYRIAVEAFVRRHGMSRYFQVGLYIRKGFIYALKADVAANPSADSLKRTATDSEGVDELSRALSDGFLRWAREIDLLRHGTLPPPPEEFLVETLFKMRWLRWADRVEAIDAFITRFEKGVVLAFQIERYPGLSVHRRLDLIRELSELDPGFPAALRSVEVLARAGRRQQARDLLSKALSEDPGSAELLDLKEQLSGGPPSPLGSERSE